MVLSLSEGHLSSWNRLSGDFLQFSYSAPMGFHKIPSM